MILAFLDTPTRQLVIISFFDIDEDYFSLTTCRDDPDGLSIDVMNVFCSDANDFDSNLCSSMSFLRIAVVVNRATRKQCLTHC